VVVRTCILKFLHSDPPEQVNFWTIFSKATSALSAVTFFLQEMGLKWLLFSNYPT
jgi:hypothetical protein